ncbi:MAG: OmpA family protein [Cyclobacteriaceae bacterium]
MKTIYFLKASLLTMMLFTVHVVFSQNIAKTEAKAETYFYQEDFKNALPLYEKILEEEPNNNMAKYKSEICSLLTYYREKPIEVLLNYEKTRGRTDKFYYYWLGRAYMRKYQFEEAIASFDKFNNIKAYKSKLIIEEVNRFRDWAIRSKEFFEVPDEYEITPLDGDINSPYSELSPVYFEDTNELLFTSNRRSDGLGKDAVFHVYHSIKNGDRWSTPTQVSILGEFPRKQANIEVVNSDGKLFLYNDNKGGDLYFSHPTTTGKWSEPEEFDSKISNTHLEAHFFINQEENRIIFASDKDSKDNGLDLYESYKNATGEWTKPEPLADIINSEFDEDSPFLSADGKTLYFSSNGHNTLGKYDVFKSSYDDNTQTWSEPTNMGFPINTPDDESNFKMNDDGRSGYFSSDRYNSKGEYDIYFFWEISKVTIRGKIIDKNTNKPLAGVEIKFHPSEYDDEAFVAYTDQNGNYRTEIISDESFRVEIIEDLKVIHNDSYTTNATQGKSIELNKDFTVDGLSDDQIASIKRDRNEVLEFDEELTDIGFLGNKFRPGNKAVTRNIYFEVGKAEVKNSSEDVLQKLLSTLQRNPDLKIEIGGHTDNIGSHDFNMALSLDRAKSVAFWLVDHGISQYRLEAKGYGETKPLASNDDEEMGRELNRRIEIIVVE